MKNLVFVFVFFFSFCSFGAVTETFNGFVGDDSIVFSCGSIRAVPCTLTVSISESGSASFACSNWYTTSSGSRTFDDVSAVGASMRFTQRNGGSATVSLTIVYPNLDDSGGGDIGGGNVPVDPENPDDGSGSGSGSDDEPWALESTLQHTNNLLNHLGEDLTSGLVNWGDWQKNTLYPKVSNILEQMFNNQETVASYGQAINNNLSSGFSNIVDWLRETLRWQVEASTGIASGNTKLDSIHSGIIDLGSGISNGNSKLDSINTGIGNLNTGINNVNSSMDTANDRLNDIRSATSGQNQTLSDIKDALQPSNTTTPSISDPSDSLPEAGGFVASVKSKLFPRGSFFSPSGDQWLTFTFTFPLSSFGLEDMTVVLGGPDWQTAAGGSLPVAMSVFRTLSKFAFYLIFLMAVIKALRQW